jgi:hypothetical protein
MPIEEMIYLGQLRPGNKNNSLVVTERAKARQLSMASLMNVNGLQTRQVGGTILQVKKREVEIDGIKFDADPYDLITMIRTVTQQIGEYKDQQNLFGKYMVAGLRKVRASMVADLQKFGIHWEIDKNSGESMFWM